MGESFETFHWKYFNQANVTRLTTNIQSFCQADVENLVDACDRFHELLFRCPNHRLNELTLIQNFNIGMNSLIRGLLDAAAEGSSMARTVEDAKTSSNAWLSAHLVVGEWMKERMIKWTEQRRRIIRSVCRSRSYKMPKEKNGRRHWVHTSLMSYVTHADVRITWLLSARRLARWRIRRGGMIKRPSILWLIKKDPCIHYTATIEPCKIQRATTGMLPVTNTEEVEIGQWTHKLRDPGICHSHLGPCKVIPGECWPLRSNITIITGQS